MIDEDGAAPETTDDAGGAADGPPDARASGRHGRRRQGGRRRPSRPVTHERLRRVAQSHLDRFQCSAAQLRAVLLRRVERSAREHGSDRDEGRAWADEIVERFQQVGALDDRRHAEVRARSLHRQGLSRRGISAWLASRGVGRDDVDSGLEAMAQDQPGDADLHAAAIFVRKRRLGPCRPPDRRVDAATDEDAARRQLGRDFAALARRGFGPDIARRVLDLPDAEAVDELIRGEPA